MSIGSFLLRPQLLDHSAETAEQDQALADLWELFRLMKEEDNLDWIFELVEEIQDLFENLIAQTEGKTNRVKNRIEARLTGFLNSLIALLGENAGKRDVFSSLEQGATLLNGTATLLESIHSEKILEIAEEILCIIEDDLGFNPAQLKTLFTGVLDNLVERLQADFVGGDTSKAAYTRYQLSRHLAKIKQHSQLFDQLPELSKENILSMIRPIIGEFDLSPHLSPIAEKIRLLASILQPAASLKSVLELDVEVEASLRDGARSIIEFMAAGGGEGLGDEKSCWYASWLHDLPIRADDPLQRLEVDQIHFSTYDAQTMEDWAFHTKWLSKWLEIIPHLLSIPFDTRNGFSTAGQPARDFLGNALNIIWQIVDFALIVGADYNIHPKWKWLIKPVMSWLGSYALPGFRYSDTYGFLTNILGVAEMTLYARWVFIAREFTLSLMTLKNHDSEEYARCKAANQARRAEIQQRKEELDGLTETSEIQAEKEALDQEIYHINRLERIQNNNQVFGFYYLGSELGAMLFTGIMALASKEDYGWADVGTSFGVTGNNGWSVGQFIVSLGVSTAMGFIGVLIAWPIADDPPEHTGDDAKHNPIFQTFLKVRAYHPLDFFEGGDTAGLVFDYIGFIIFWIADDLLKYAQYLFIFHEGKTEGGKFLHPELQNVLGGKFNGYQDPATSPYILPYPQGDLHQCVQGHCGSFSHTPVSIFMQMYSLDFDHNFKEPVHAMRSGIAWTIVESTPDGNDATANRIILLHHEIDAPEHDTHIGNDPARTFAEYLHGAHNGVSTAINTSLAPNQISSSPHPTVNDLINEGNKVIASFLAVNVDLLAMQDNSQGGQPIPVVQDGLGNTVGPLYILQGKYIMEADSTGRSAYNHLHINLVANADGPDIRRDGTPMNVRSTLNRFTIPWVFHDVGGDGVPKTYIHYEGSVTPPSLTTRHSFILASNTAVNIDPTAPGGVAITEGDNTTIEFELENTSGGNVGEILVMATVPPQLNYVAGTMAGERQNAGGANVATLEPQNMVPYDDPILVWRAQGSSRSGRRSELRLPNSHKFVLSFDATRTKVAPPVNVDFKVFTGIMDAVEFDRTHQKRVPVEIEIENTGAEDSGEIIVKLAVPEGLPYIPNSIAGESGGNPIAGTDDSDPSSLEWTLNDLASGNTASLTFEGEPTEESDRTISPQIYTTNIPDIAVNTQIAAPAPNGNRTATIELTNNSPAAISNLRIENILPEAFNYVDSSISGGSSRDDSNTEKLKWEINNIAAAAQEDLEFDLSTDAGEDDRMNTISIRKNSSSRLEIDASVNNPGAANGDAVTVRLNVKNPGNNDVSDIFVELRLPPGFNYTGNISGGDIRNDAAAPVLQWRIKELEDGDDIRLQLEATRTADDDVNCVVLYSASGINMSNNPTVDPEYERISLEVQNFRAGNLNNIKVESFIPPGFTYRANSIAGGTARNDGNAPTLEWTLNVNGNNSTTLTYDVNRVANPNKRHIFTEYRSGAPGRLDVSATLSNPNAAEGDSVDVTLTVENPGGAAIDDIMVSLVVPKGFSFHRDKDSLTGGTVREIDIDPNDDRTILIWRIEHIDANGGANDSFDLEFSAKRTDDENLDMDVRYSLNPNPGAFSRAITPAAAVLGPLAGGDEFFVGIEVTNNSATDGVNIILQDIVPAGFNYVPGSITGGVSNSDKADPYLTWRLAPLPNNTQPNNSTGGTTPGVAPFIQLGYKVTRTQQADLTPNARVIAVEAKKSS